MFAVPREGHDAIQLDGFYFPFVFVGHHIGRLLDGGKRPLPIPPPMGARIYNASSVAFTFILAV